MLATKVFLVRIVIVSRNLQSKKVAIRYAVALYRALVSDTKSLEKIYFFSKEVCQVFSVKKMRIDLNQIVRTNPKSVIDLMKSCLREANIKTRAFDHFLEMLLDRKRMDILPEILFAFIEEYQAKHDIEVVTVTSALKLDSKMKTYVKNYLEKHLQKMIEFDFDEDPSVIAGLRIQMGSKMIDMTLSNHLKKLEMTMKEASNG